ncbi:MAG: type II toxin-antitoxin system RelE/ParE family toxin [Oligoflexia bacterium]|nr:type II toxin-antitoxin system RelE/ParE family toxin [Oligoflexia bacterium]
MKLDVVVIGACEKEIKDLPEEIRCDFLDAIARLKEGILLSMPLSRPMPSIAPGVSELRLKDRSGIYRIFYLIRKNDAIYVLHAFKKTTQETPKKNIEIAKARIKRFL